MDSKSENSKWETIQLAAEEELRISIPSEVRLTVVLEEGTAEIFGMEMAPKHPYQFKSSLNSVPIFTFSSARIQLTSESESQIDSSLQPDSGNQGQQLCHSYVASETPMIAAVNLWSFLYAPHLYPKNKLTESPHRAPCVLFCGAQGSGKSSLAKTFLNYSTRYNLGKAPLFVELDPDQSLLFPGALGSATIEGPLSSVVSEDPLSFPTLLAYYGYDSPQHSPDLFKGVISVLAEKVKQKLQKNPQLESLGCIINTSGWLENGGHDILTYCIEKFNVDAIVTIDHERLYNDLMKKYSGSKAICKIQKSGGALNPSASFRQENRMQKIKDYFYGPTNTLFPHSIIYKCESIHIMTVVKRPPPPSHTLPIGSAAVSFSPLCLKELSQEKKLSDKDELLNKVLAISQVERKEEDKELTEELGFQPILGFVAITEIDTEKETITLLSPNPVLPRAAEEIYFILGGIELIEE